MRASRVALALALGALALNIVAFAGLERRSRALTIAEAELSHALDTARPSGVVQQGEPPRGLLIFAFYSDDYGDGVTDLCGSVGRWNGRSLIHTYYEDGKAISYAVSNMVPLAWYPVPNNL